MGKIFSYTLYDPLGRITEVGEKPKTNAANLMTQAISQDNTALQTWLNTTTTAEKKEQITRTVYDDPWDPFCDAGNPALNILCQKNLRNRVSYTYVKNTDDNSSNYTWDAATLYSYDIHGNVDTLLQDYKTGMGAIDCDINNSGGNRWKKMVYKYDLISGKVNEVAYQPGKVDQFYHQYGYDAENRLINLKTSRDHIYWENDASYTYYRHGPLARTVLGELQVQGLDYAYMLQGWLKGVNSTVVGDGTYDMGEDGKTGSVNSLVARDAYGFSLNYFSGDYAQINPAVNAFSAVSNNLPNPSSDNLHAGSDLFNGNIRAMLVNIPKLTNVNLYGYRYDQLNRIVAMNTYNGVSTASNTLINPSSASQDYNERITYDANGNILGYLRNGAQAVHGWDMDSLTYKYDYYTSANVRKTYIPGGAVPADAARLTNRLNYVKDIGGGTYTEDIKDENPNNYTYDKIGNLTSDVKENISLIEWTVYGKISHIHKTTDNTDIYYAYDASGNRISKTISKTVSTITTTKTSYYVRDASGNVMSIYESGETAINGGDLTQSEIHLYGSSRLGIYNVAVDVQCTSTAQEITTYIRGDKFFELSNHLGNVLVTVSDKKLAIASTSNSSVIDHYEAYVITAQDYYPFGMMMVGRKFEINSTSKYRYSINGQEKESELNENITTALYWEYDSRIGRRWNIDPKSGISVSGFACFMNNPIFNVDIRGDSAVPNKQTGEIAANFKFVKGTGVTDDQFEKYQQYFKERVTQTYNTKGTVNTGTNNVPVTSNFTYGTATSVPAQIPLGDNYIVVNADNGQRSNVNSNRNIAQMNVNDMNVNNGNNNRASHEVGHLFGLSDRYHYVGNMAAIPGNSIVLPGTQTIPMNLPPGTDPEYNLTSNNLMSVSGNQVTSMQWQIIFGGASEQRYPIATFYVQLGNSGIRQQASINNAVFLGMNLYRIKDVLKNTYKDRPVTNHMPSFFILNGGTRVLNLNTNIQGSGNMSENLWNNTPNQNLIQQSQQ